jgi:hypothetical protein
VAAIIGKCIVPGVSEHLQVRLGANVSGNREGRRWLVSFPLPLGKGCFIVCNDRCIFQNMTAL